MTDVANLQSMALIEKKRKEEASVCFEYWLKLSGLQDAYHYIRRCLEKRIMVESLGDNRIVPVTTSSGIVPALLYRSKAGTVQVVYGDYTTAIQFLEPAFAVSLENYPQEKELEFGISYHFKLHNNSKGYFLFTLIDAAS